MARDRGGLSPEPEPRRALLGRAGVRRGLGLFWLLDAALQAEPAKFSPHYPLGVLAQAAMGLPPWAHDFVYAAIRPLAGHWVAWNLAVVLLQGLIGAGLVSGKAPRVFLAASVAWALAVWAGGEGFGFLPSGQALFLAGAPGPAIVYAALGVLAWPRPGRADVDLRAWSVSWAALWLGGALLQEAGRWPAAEVLRANLEENALGQPAWLSAGAHAAAALALHHPLAVPALLAVVQVAVGLGPLTDRRRRQAWLGAGLALAALFWVVGQQAGGVLSPDATDVGLGPLVILLGASAPTLRSAAGAGGDGADRKSTGRNSAGRAGRGWHRWWLAIRLGASAAAALAAGTVRPAWGRALLRRQAADLAWSEGLRITATGANRLEPGQRYLLVANHSSPLDIPALLIARPAARFLMAADLVPRLLRPVVARAFGVVFVARRHPLQAARALEGIELGEGAELVVFPEGGIAPAGQRLPFKTGAFALAAATGASVVPVAIHHSAARLPPRSRLSLTPGRLVVEILDPLPAAGPGSRARRELRDRASEAILGALGPADGGRRDPGPAPRGLRRPEGGPGWKWGGSSANLAGP